MWTLHRTLVMKLLLTRETYHLSMQTFCRFQLMVSQPKNSSAACPNNWTKSAPRWINFLKRVHKWHQKPWRTKMRPFRSSMQLVRTMKRQVSSTKWSCSPRRTINKRSKSRTRSSLRKGASLRAKWSRRTRPSKRAVACWTRWTTSWRT